MPAAQQPMPLTGVPTGLAPLIITWPAAPDDDIDIWWGMGCAPGGIWPNICAPCMLLSAAMTGARSGAKMESCGLGAAGGGAEVDAMPQPNWPGARPPTGSAPLSVGGSVVGSSAGG